jgi:hypothetical protein
MQRRNKIIKINKVLLITWKTKKALYKKDL